MLSEEGLESHQDSILEQFFPAEIQDSGFVEGASYCDPAPEQGFNYLFAGEIEPPHQPFIPSDTETLDRTPSSVISSRAASDTVHRSSPYINIPSSLPLECDTSHASISEPSVQYTCDTCFRSFKRKCDLNHHQRTHTREYKCTYADCSFLERGFATSRDLRSHLDTFAHGKSPNAKIPCPHPGCDSIFTRGYNL